MARLGMVGHFECPRSLYHLSQTCIAEVTNSLNHHARDREPIQLRFRYKDGRWQNDDLRRLVVQRMRSTVPKTTIPSVELTCRFPGVSNVKIKSSNRAGASYAVTLSTWALPRCTTLRARQGIPRSPPAHTRQLQQLVLHRHHPRKAAVLGLGRSMLINGVTTLPRRYT